MIGRWAVGIALIGVVAAAPGARAQQASQVKSTLACVPQADVAGRPSPYDSVAVAAGGLQAKVCYSRPYVKGRTIFGAEGSALVPFGKLWRTGANEPTTIHLAAAAEVAGLAVAPGSYSIYTVPGEREWTVIVNRSTSQWGHEGRYTAEVQAQEVGRAQVPAESLASPVEQFTIRGEPKGEGAAELILEWATTRVRIPVKSRSM